tara:strand:- start:667 stop:903 length:237 start_codon:yes stop_codon:yes gene_type:complete
MFTSNQVKQSNIAPQNNEKIIDPFTIWLIRITCILIILVFSLLALGLPLAISFGQSIINETVLNAKEILRNLIEASIV